MTESVVDGAQPAALPRARKAYDTHPAADLFPPMKGAAFDDLVADIKKNGLLEPIWRYEGKTLDGRNREKACEKAGVEPRYREYEGDDPFGFVTSMNIRRRHLSPKQKRALIDELLKAKPERSNRATAEMAGVSDKTVASIRAEAEARAEIPNVENRQDTKGREQPARKKAKHPESSLDDYSKWAAKLDRLFTRGRKEWQMRWIKAQGIKAQVEQEKPKTA